MIVLPLIVNDMIFSLDLSFKKIQRRKEVLQADKINLPANDLVVGKVSLKEGNNPLYDKNAIAVTRFIRKFMVNNYVKSLYITTSNYHQTDFYDVYKVPCPPNYSYPVIDFLYGNLVNDLRLRDPEKEKAKMISLKQIGMDELFNDDVLDDLLKIKKECHNHEEFVNKITEHGYGLQVQILQFLDTLDFKIIDQTLLSIKNLDIVANSFQAIPNRIDKQLAFYRQLARDNYQSYTVLARANHIIHDKPLTWPMLSVKQQKILQKKVA